MSDVIEVEVVYGLPSRQVLLVLQVARGTTALEAVQRSGISVQFPGLDVTQCPMGIFGQAFGTKGLPPASEYILQAGDRVEIYRPLISDPKEVRRRRAAKAAGDA